MTTPTYRADGKPELKLNISVGWVPGYSASGWTQTSQCTVIVTEDDTFQAVIDQVKKTAPTAKADKIFAVDKNGQKMTLDPHKTMKELGFDRWHKLELRMPNALA
eukprot:TRINITY_DN15246_c0_g1_i1.p2 TRINITY_DN15246_c0_g1~~TRINITY_DN15246_c0_g1_i1.p2  ORF type:complete len:105 (-),score=22.38 TRINITY_DN15246_c0_g1_i1:95-409(-)